jgi:hypothetical protein
MYRRQKNIVEQLLVEKAKPPKGGDAKLKGLRLRDQLRQPAAETSGSFYKIPIDDIQRRDLLEKTSITPPPPLARRAPVDLFLGGSSFFDASIAEIKG